ncbi:MAG: hypothetical protein KBT48_05645 [Firmicutes bacterium]|nr:hypothetical protein [Bacillota bacterium]
MKVLNKLTSALAKLFEVCVFLAGIILLVVLGLLFFFKADVTAFILEGLKNGTVTISGISEEGLIQLINGNGIYVFGAFAFIACFLYGMIFRNVNLIMRTAVGKTKFSVGNTPFQEDVVRMVREIGIFSISIPILQVILSVIATMNFGVTEITPSLNGIFFGFVILCLSQYFAYGASLQEEVDGLI